MYTVSGVRALSTAVVLLVGSMLEAVPAVSQGRELVALDLAGTPPGRLPAGITVHRGRLELVEKDGVRMLKASSPTEFLLELPRALPRDFAIEFALVPKASRSPSEDLSFEGTRELGRSAGSAHVMWGSGGHTVLGGGEAFRADMPPDLRDVLPGTLTRIVVSVEDETLRLYTNGRRLYTLSERRFARGRVLRVFLGGEDGGAKAVHLAGLRIVEGAGSAVIAGAVPPPPPPGPMTPPPAPPPPPPVPPPPPANDGLLEIGNFSLAPKLPWGVEFRWSRLSEGVWYTIEYSDNGQAFAKGMSTHYGSNLTAEGLHRGVMESVEPGHQYQYRVIATAADRITVVARSPLLSYQAPTAYPRVGNLKASVGEFSQVTLGNGSTAPGRKVTWTWDGVPGAQSYQVRGTFTTPMPGGQPATAPLFSGSTPNQQSGFSLAFAAPATVSLCVSAIPLTVTSAFVASECVDAEVGEEGATSPAPPPPPAPLSVITVMKPVTATATPMSSLLPPRTLVSFGFAGQGVSSSLVPRGVVSPGFAGAGPWLSVQPVAISTASFSGVGTAAATGVSALIAVAASGFSGSGPLNPLAPRTAASIGFSGTGHSTTVPPRTLQATGFSGTGPTP